MSIEYGTQVAEELIAAIPEFRGQYEEHLRDNDELLLHLLIADLARFVVAAERAGDMERVDRSLAAVERVFVSGDELTTELVAVSFVGHSVPRRSPERPKSSSGSLMSSLLSYEGNGTGGREAGLLKSLRPSSQATRARRSSRGERWPLSSEVGTTTFLCVRQPASKCLCQTCPRKDAKRATLVASRGLHRGLHHMLIRDPSGTSDPRIQAKSL
jgi:hypothetical protein